MTFDEIEDCMPDGDGCWSHDETGRLLVTAQWLHDFAESVAKTEREACAKVCEARYMGDNNREDMEARRCAQAIRMRSNS